MAQLGKVDWICVGLMVTVILLASGYLALYHGWVLMWLVIGLVVVFFGIFVITSRWRINRAG
jgi:hypothetical protein